MTFASRSGTSTQSTPWTVPILVAREVQHLFGALGDGRTYPIARNELNIGFGALGDGRTYPIARNELNIGTAQEPEFSEFTGVTFSPDGRTLFANIQVPGIMPAITGPWRRQGHGGAC